MSDSLWPHGLYSPWNSPGQNTGVGSCSLLQGIFPNQESNPGLPRCTFFIIWATREAHSLSCTNFRYGLTATQLAMWIHENHAGSCTEVCPGALFSSGHPRSTIDFFYGLLLYQSYPPQSNSYSSGKVRRQRKYNPYIKIEFSKKEGLDLNN